MARPSKIARINPETLAAARAGGMSIKDLAKLLGVGRTTVWRVLEQQNWVLKHQRGVLKHREPCNTSRTDSEKLDTDAA